MTYPVLPAPSPSHCPGSDRRCDQFRSAQQAPREPGIGLAWTTAYLEGTPEPPPPPARRGRGLRRQRVCSGCHDNHGGGVAGVEQDVREAMRPADVAHARRATTQLYDLRHGFASLLLAAGEHAKVADLLGHSTTG